MRNLPDCLRVESNGGIRVVSINRPETQNAINAELHEALSRVWSLIAADETAKVVVITGVGNAFSAGGDLDWIASFEEDHDARDQSLTEAHTIIDEMLHFPLPVIAAVNGPAVGLGCSIVALSDIALMAEDSYLADPHVAVGLTAGDGGAAFWPLLTPIMRSREFLFTGDPLSADEAVAVGLGTRVVPNGELATEALRVAKRLERLPAQALRSTKQVVNMYLSQALTTSVPAGLAAEAETMTSPDHRGIMAAIQKRQGSK